MKTTKFLIARSLAVITAFALVGAFGCGPDKKIALPTSVPTSVGAVVTDSQIYAAGAYVMTTLENLMDLADKTSAAYVTVPAGLIPTEADRRIRAGFRMSAQEAMRLSEDIKNGVVKEWAALKARIDPILKSVASVVTTARSISEVARGHGGWWAMVKDLASTAMELFNLGPAGSFPSVSAVDFALEGAR